MNTSGNLGVDHRRGRTDAYRRAPGMARSVLAFLLVVAVIAVSGGVDAPAAAAADGDVEWVSGAGDFNPWGTGFPVPIAPTDPAQARYTVYATTVVAASGVIYVRDYDTIVEVDPTSGITRRVAGYYADPMT